jgi:F-type H+-transporting ATPase subunit beta
MRARLLERFLTQPFFTTEQFTGLTGKLVSLKDALDGCERILHDEFKDYPESGLYMIGAISEAKGKPKAVPPATTAKPEAKPGAKVESKPADKGKPEAKNDPKAEQISESESEPKPKVAFKPAAPTPAKAVRVPLLPEVKPQPKDEHADIAHAS